MVNLIKYFSMLCLMFGLVGSAGAEERPQDHDALRALLIKGAEALNTGNIDMMAPLLHKQFTIITVDNQKFTQLAAFKSYWNGLLQGEGRLITKIEAKPVADELTQFLGNDVGVVHGTSADVYHFRDGDVRTMDTRWTAVVAKEDGIWKLVKLHSSVNLLNNPLLTATRQWSATIAAISAAVTLLLGLVVGLILGRRTK